MEAPEKIYVHVKNNKVTNTWNSTWKGIRDVEYIHKDAFIEKVCEYFAPYIKDNSGGYDRAFVLENFKKYIEG